MRINGSWMKRAKLLLRKYGMGDFQNLLVLRQFTISWPAVNERADQMEFLEG